MKKKYTVTSLLILVILMLSGCSNKALEEATAAVGAYNAAAESFNKSAEPYNEAVNAIETANNDLQEIIDNAQAAIDAGEEPFDESTLTTLKDAMSAAAEVKIAVPESLPVYEKMTVSEDAKRSELEAMTEDANAKTEEINSTTIPDLPEIPDYTEVSKNVSEATVVYQDSIQSLKQVTMPSEDFIKERLQSIETITAMEAVTEDHDPNGMLNKQGGYTCCVYFTDTQVDRSQLYIEDGKDNVIDVGTDGGGAIEVFRTTKEAETRNEYLGSFDGTGFSSGSHYVVGTCIIRTSNELSGTQQLELTDKITEALTKVVH